VPLAFLTRTDVILAVRAAASGGLPGGAAAKTGDGSLGDAEALDWGREGDGDVEVVAGVPVDAVGVLADVAFSSSPRKAESWPRASPRTVPANRAPTSPPATIIAMNPRRVSCTDKGCHHLRSR
jgi:hypothetical protein